MAKEEERKMGSKEREDTLGKARVRREDGTGSGREEEQGGIRNIAKVKREVKFKRGEEIQGSGNRWKKKKKT